MRILQISSAKNYGGGEKHLVDLTKGLIQNGHELFLAVPADSPVLEKMPDFPKERILPVRIKYALDFFTARKIAKFIKQNDIEIVHAHAAKDYFPANLAVKFSKNAKLILTRHVLFPMKSPHKLALKNVSKVIAVSSAVEANLQKTFPADKIVTVPNGIDVENWANVETEKLRKEFRFENNIPFDATLVGTVGELKRLKGQQDFILAAREIVKKFSDTHFVIVGKDHSLNQEFRRDIKRLVKVFDLEEKFTFFDWIEDTKPLLSSLDIFVSPSHSESFGLAILEAMASGCAIVSTETAGAKELIKHKKSGLLTEKKDPLKLAETICEILEDEKKQKTLGQNAQIRAREKFGLERMIAATENIYREL